MNKRKTIKGLLIQYMLIGMVSIFAVAVTSMSIISSHMQDEMGDKGKKIVEVLSNSINTSLEHPLDDLYSLKELIEDENIIADIGDLLSNIVNNRDHFAAIQLVDFNGEVTEVSPYREEFLGIDVSRQEYFINSIKSNEPYWSSTLLSAQLDRPFVSLSLKTQKGLLVAFLLPETILDHVQKLVNLSKSYITVSDRTGVFIVHPYEEKVSERVNDPYFNKLKSDYYKGSKESIENIDGDQMLVYVEFIESLGWMIKFHQSLEIVLKPIYRILLVLGLLAITTTIIFALFASGQLVKVSTSLENIIQNTVKVADGDYDVHLQETSFVDLNSVINSFNVMASSLSERERELVQLNKRIQTNLDRLTHADHTFKTLLESTTGRYGQEFMDNLTREIAGWFGVDAVIVSKFDYETGVATAVAMNMDGKKVEGYQYPIKGSPCERVAEDGFGFFGKDVINLFPEDEDLQKFHAEAYLGVPMKNAGGEVKGIICAISKDPMTLPEWGQDFMTITASKVIAEMERMDAERKIIESLKEKEIMLKEIHHRVKNNMQIVIGLLSLQKQVSEPIVVHQLNESINRIYVMALVHEQLYKSNDLAKIEVSDYVKSLLGHIIHTSNIGKHIELNTDIDCVSFSIEDIIHIGLIVNELVTNSIKHAFATTENPRLSVSIKDMVDSVELIVADNGVGFPSGFNFSSSETLGLHLVDSLSGSLNGKMSISEKGTGATIRLNMARKSI